MTQEPDIQFFRESGIWHRPEGAVRVEVMIKGGDAGGSVGQDGAIIPGEEGEIVIKEMTADEAGPTVPVSVGGAGCGGSREGVKAPDGSAGYAVVVTYFS